MAVNKAGNYTKPTMRKKIFKKVIKGLKKASNSHKKQAQTLTKVIKS